jgi:argininosuccinate lyase
VNDAFHWLCEINKASAVMTIERGIVPRSLAAPIARAIAEVAAGGAKPGAERPGDYLKLEALLIAAGGPDVTRVHSGRSRQDINATFGRLFLREDMLATLAALNGARDALLTLAEAHADAIVPAYTWGVQARLCRRSGTHGRADEAGLRSGEFVPPGQRGSGHLQLSC